MTRPIDADLILLSGEAGLPALRAARAETPTRPVPSVDLTGRLTGACDVSFRVGEPASWAAVAEACIDYAARRAGLGLVEGPVEPAAHLLALLQGSARDLPLAGGEGGLADETGLSPAALMGAVLTLTEAGALACLAAGSGVRVRLTEAGRRAPTARPLPGAPARPSVLDARKTAELTRLVGEAELRRLRDRLMGQLATALAP